MHPPFHILNRNTATVAILGFCSLTAVAKVGAETAYSAPVGFVRFEVPTGSDRVTSIPLERPPRAVESVGAVVGEEITVLGLPGWEPSQFVYDAASGQTDTFYLRITSGSKIGRYFTVVGNGTDTVQVFTGGEVLVGNDDPNQDLAEGDTFKIIPYWTLNTVFPNGQGITPSPSIFSRATEILFADSAGSGINKAPGAPYYFFNGTWRNTSTGSVNRGDVVILPDSHFVIRQNASGPISPAIPGAVPMELLGSLLKTRTNSAQDNPVSLARPSGSATGPDATPYAGVSLNGSGLFESGAITPGTSIFSRGDQVLVYDNTIPGKNRAPSKTYYHLNGAWRRVGAPGNPDVGDELVFLPGEGVVIRKARTGLNPSPAVVWLNVRDYLSGE